MAVGKIFIPSVLAISVAFSMWLIAFAPEWIDDTNRFFRNFVTHELLNVLGIIVAITLASGSNLYVQFNVLEDAVQERFLQKPRLDLIRSVYLLICTFIAAILLVIIKPLLGVSSETQAFFNAVAVILLIDNILTLVDLSRSAFKVPSKLDLLGGDGED